MSDIVTTFGKTLPVLTESYMEGGGGGNHSSTPLGTCEDIMAPKL